MVTKRGHRPFRRQKAPDLRARWIALWERAGGHPVDGNTVYDELAFRYDEIHRHWHRLRHVHVCLTMFDKVRQHLADPMAVEFALWFHRSVYYTDSTRFDLGFAESAALAVRRLVRVGERDLGNRVSSLVLSMDPWVEKRDEDRKILSDLERAVFAADAKVFDYYDALIRREYAWITLDSAWIDVRLAFLTRMFKRKFYRSRAVESAFGTAARHNLLRAIARLRAGHIIA